MADPPEKKPRVCERPLGRFSQWCEGMALALAGAPRNSEGKGLSVMEGWVDDDTTVALRGILGIVYRPKPRAQGIVLNTCPWCGQNVNFTKG